MSAIRSDRMNEEVKKTISEIVREMKDPRISSMTSWRETTSVFTPTILNCSDLHTAKS